jgi:glucose-6-phosphate-specific signal transduction histidine kinase
LTDRALLFLLSLAALIGAVAAAVWLIATGQTGTFDGNFLLVVSLVIAAAFGLYIKFMIRKTMEQPAQKPARVAEKKSMAEQEPVGKI